MKIYVTRRGREDFVCHADTIGDAIVMFWLATGETPRASYRVHYGRRRQAKTISSAIAFWLLGDDMRSRLYDVLQETTTDSQFNEFCEIAVQAGSLLGK